MLDYRSHGPRERNHNRINLKASLLRTLLSGMLSMRANSYERWETHSEIFGRFVLLRRKLSSLSVKIDEGKTF